MSKDRLVTPSYCLILAANFLLYFGFWLLIPVLPFYLNEVFRVAEVTIGIVLSCYTIAALCIRPFSGYLLDTFARKPLYLFAYFIFMLIFAGYMLAGTLTLFIILRIVHGLSFGTVTVGGNTLVIDIMPSSRRGEGLGYYGLANNIAMSIGPMFGLFLHNAGESYTVIFSYALGACILGLLAASMVKTTYRPPGETRSHFPGPVHPAERHSGRNQSAPAFHSLRHDHQLCSHVCQTNRHYRRNRILLHLHGFGNGCKPSVQRTAGG